MREKKTAVREHHLSQLNDAMIEWKAYEQRVRGVFQAIHGNTDTSTQEFSFQQVCLATQRRIGEEGVRALKSAANFDALSGAQAHMLLCAVRETA